MDDAGTEFTERGNNYTFNPGIKRGNSILHMKTRFYFNQRKVTKADKAACSRKKVIYILKVQNMQGCEFGNSEK